MIMFCAVCKANNVELRLDLQDGAFGPRFEYLCEKCYEKDVNERKEEGRKFKYKPKIVPWLKLQKFTQ